MTFIIIDGAAFSKTKFSQVKKALKEDKNFLAGLNVCKGQVTYKAVANVFGHEYVDPALAL